MEIKRSGSQPSGKGPAEYFTGTVRIDPLFQAHDPARAVGASVTFEPGARTAWHTHPHTRDHEIYLLSRSRAAHIVADQRELLEVLLEASGEFSRLPVVGISVGPGIAGIEHLDRHIGTGRWYIQAKDGIGRRLDVI